jgi:hypothetical protein
MNEFLQWRDWFSVKYRFLVGEAVRYFSMKTALNILHQRGGMNIVETGTIRAENDFSGGGNSTYLFGDYAQHYDKKFWTVDILPEAIELSKKITEGFNSHTTFVLSDSILFLKTFPEKIDLLYLDSMDCPITDVPGSRELLASQRHQRYEIEAAWDKLHDKSVVLLDDNDFTNGGKCPLTIDFLESKGWINLINDKQSLWIKG